MSKFDRLVIIHSDVPITMHTERVLSVSRSCTNNIFVQNHPPSIAPDHISMDEIISIKKKYFIGIYGQRSKCLLDWLFRQWIDSNNLLRKWMVRQFHWIPCDCVVSCCAVMFEYRMAHWIPCFGQWASITKSLYIESLFGIYIVSMKGWRRTGGEWE